MTTLRQYIYLFLILLCTSTPNAWAQKPVRNAPDTVHYRYSVIAKRTAKQSIVLDGLQIKNFGDGGFGNVFTLTDNGNLFFVANTDKGSALFENQKALAYFGKPINGGTFVDAGAAVPSEGIDAINEASGDILYQMAYEAGGHTDAVAVLNDKIVYKYKYPNDGAGFTKDGRYAIPIIVSSSSPLKWLIGGTLQDAAPDGSVLGTAPITGIPDTRIVHSLVHTRLYADELYQKELGITQTTYDGHYHAKIGHVDIIGAEYPNWHYKESRNHKGQIAILLSADDVTEGPAPDPSDVAQVIILATPTNAPISEPDIPFRTVLLPAFTSDTQDGLH